MRKGLFLRGSKVDIPVFLRTTPVSPSGLIMDRRKEAGRRGQVGPRQGGLVGKMLKR
jgi:hypothetical protein